MGRWKPDAEGRLMRAAIALFDERGYDDTTVADIADRAGLTKRTFFRHFADKREVLFNGSEQLEDLWREGIATAPQDAPALAQVTAAFDLVAGMFVERHELVRRRARIISANPELQERELIKLQRLAAAIQRALRERGISANATVLAAQAGVTVFHVAFGRWVEQDDPAALRTLMDESLEELRALTTA